MDQGWPVAQRLLALRGLQRKPGCGAEVGEGAGPGEHAGVREPRTHRHQGLSTAWSGHRGRGHEGMMDDDDRRMIEFEIPLVAVSEASSKEKKHPRRHVELIHQWPARRPRSASRAAVAAALLRVPKSENEIEERLQLLADLAPYECSATTLEKARRLIREEHGGQAPKVL